MAKIWLATTSCIQRKCSAAYTWCAEAIYSVLWTNILFHRVHMLWYPLKDYTLHAAPWLCLITSLLVTRITVSAHPPRVTSALVKCGSTASETRKNRQLSGNNHTLSFSYYSLIPQKHPLGWTNHLNAILVNHITCRHSNLNIGFSSHFVKQKHCPWSQQRENERP